MLETILEFAISTLSACAKGDRNGKVISLITKRNYSEVEAALGLSHSVDVTGGMKKKVEEFIAISSLGIDCWIIDGNRPNNLVQAISGKPTSETLIQAFPSLSGTLESTTK